MKIITIAQIHRWRPCDMGPGGKYSRDGLKALFGGRRSITPLEALDLPIPVADRFWLLFRPEIISKRDLHLLACDFAEHVQPERADPRSLAAIETKRRWVDGAATDEELGDARVTILGAALAAKRGTSAMAAAQATAWDARDAARDTATIGYIDEKWQGERGREGLRKTT